MKFSARSSVHLHSTDKTKPQRRGVLVVGAAAIIATALALTGCSSPTGPAPTSAAASGDTPVAGGTLNVALAALPAVIDPYATSLQANWIIARNVCEPLFDVSNGLEVKPVLVDTYTYDNKLTYVLKLRKSVKFQDGEPFEAKDVISSLKRYYLTPGNGSILAGLVKSAVATDSHTVTLTLNSTSALIPTLLTTAYMMPASIQDGANTTTPVAKLICTGPYTVASVTPGQEITLKKWSGYTSPTGTSDGAVGKKNAYLDSIVFKPIPADSTRVQAVQTGLADATFGTLDDYAALATSSTAKATVLAKSSSPSVVFNKTSGIMANVKMRQAFLAALNMSDIMAAAFGDQANYAVDGSIFTAISKTWHTEAGTKGKYNLHDAATVKKLLAEAGYKGEPIVWLTTQDDPTWYGPSVPAQQQLKKLGINIDLQVSDQATIIAKRTDPSKFDLFSSAIPTYADPLLLPYLQDTFPGKWIDPKKTALLQTLSSAPKAADRVTAWGELQTLIYTDIPFVKFGTVAGGIAVLSNKTHIADPAFYGNGLYFNMWKTK